MKSHLLVSFSFLFLFIVTSKSSPSQELPNKRVMVWMCLERCNNATQTDIDLELIQLEANSKLLSAVSFEKYNLGPNSQLVLNNLSNVLPTIHSMGLEAWPMVSSYPYPADFIVWMRQVFADPQPFIDSCISEAVANNYTGYNIDWEPTVGVTEEDATLYAEFLTTFADALHEERIQVSVDIAPWSPLCEYYGGSAVRHGMESWDAIWRDWELIHSIDPQGTYTGSDLGFIQELNSAVGSIGVQQLGIGMQIINPNTNLPLTSASVALRFDTIIKNHVREVDLWRSPLLPFWWDYIGAYLSDV